MLYYNRKKIAKEVFFSMNILSHILNFETKNLLINQLILKIKNFITDFIESILINFSHNRYIYNFLNFQKSFNHMIVELIIKFIEFLDNEYKNSNIRKKDYYINKSNVQRTIYTIYGEITFNRTLYKNKINGSYHFYIDKLLGIEAYNLYDPIVRSISISDAVNSNPNNASYHSSLDSLNILDAISRNGISQISRQSIYRWTRNININVNYETINNGSTLYVMADEKWIHKQDKNNKGSKKYIMSKCFVIFTGIKITKKRSKLLGKHIFITTTSSPYKELMDEICKIYDFAKITTINLLSDAGTWILAGKDELKLYTHNNIVVNTCEFHVKQKINRTTTDKLLREKLCSSIYEHEYKKEFIKIMDEIIESKDKQSRKEKITEYKKYIIKHWKGIISMKHSDIKSSMEAHISHCIASKFGSRPKAYSDNYCYTYLKLQEAYLNNINILDYCLKFFSSSDDFIYNEKENNFSLFDKSFSNLPVITSSNPISYILNNLAYPNTTI